MRPSDLPVLLGSAQRLHQDTGWKPHLSMEQTLDDILSDWRLRVAQEHATAKGQDRA